MCLLGGHIPQHSAHVWPQNLGVLHHHKGLDPASSSLVQISIWFCLQHSLPSRQAWSQAWCTHVQKGHLPSRGEGMYALAKAHNNQMIIKSSQLLASVILDLASSLSLIREGMQHNEFATCQILLLNMPTPHQYSTSPQPEPHYSLTAAGNLVWKGALYVLNYRSTCLTLLQSCHDHHLAGHPGISKTTQLLCQQYFWPNVTQDVTCYVQSCPTCHHAKTVHHKPYGPLQFLPIPEQPWSSILMDFIEGLPMSSGHDTILVIVDQLTKMALFIPTHAEDDSPQLAKIFLAHIFSKHGTPTDIVSDRGKHFVSHFWSSLCMLLGIKSNLSTMYHP